MSSTRELCDVADIPIEVEDPDIPEGETPAEKLRLLHSWLIEDSDLPAAEAQDFAQAVAVALDALGEPL